MATSKIQVTEGSGKNIATNSLTEDAVTKEVQRVVPNNSSGVEIGNAATPIQVSLANTAVNATAIKTDGSGATQPVSVASLPLPSGAATAAKQPALGTAGTPSADVLTVQGVTSMTALKVDGSAVTQPVSVAAAIPTNADAAIGAGTAPAKALVGGGVYNSTEPSPTTGQTMALQLDAKGRSKTTLRDAAGNDRGANVNASNQLSVSVDNTPSVNATLAAETTKVIGTVNISASQTVGLATGTNSVGKISDVTTSVTPGTAAANLGKAEDAAAANGDTGVFVLGVRNETLTAPTNADGDYQQVSLDNMGRVMADIAPTAAMVRGNASATNTTSTSLVAASGSASLKTYIVACQVANTGATTVEINLQDGSGGTTLCQLIAPAGGGGVYTFPVPIVTSANTALYFAASGSSTTVYVSAQGYKAP